MVSSEDLAGLFGVKPSEHAQFVQQMQARARPSAIKHGIKTMTSMLMGMGKQVVRAVVNSTMMTRSLEDFAESSVQTRRTVVDPLTGEERTTTEYVTRDDRTSLAEQKEDPERPAQAEELSMG